MLSSHTLPSRPLLRSARKQTGPGGSGHHLYPTSTRGTVRFKGLNTTPEEDVDEMEMNISSPTSTVTMTLPSVRSSGTVPVCDGLPHNGSCGPPLPPTRQRVDLAATSTPSRIVLPESLSSSSATSRSPCIFVTTSRSFDVWWMGLSIWTIDLRLQHNRWCSLCRANMVRWSNCFALGSVTVTMVSQVITSIMCHCCTICVLLYLLSSSSWPTLTIYVSSQSSGYYTFIRLHWRHNSVVHCSPFIFMSSY